MTSFDTLILPRLREFYNAFDASLDFRLWVKLIEEETAELLDAMREGDHVNALKEASDLVYVIAGSTLCRPEDDSIFSKAFSDHIEAVLDEAAKALKHFYVTYDHDDEVLLEAFLRVHASNMSKLGDDGKPIRREDGKVMKGPNYAPPDLSDLVN